MRKGPFGGGRGAALVVTDRYAEAGEHTSHGRMDHPAGEMEGLRGLHQLRRCLTGLGDLPAFVLRHDVRSGRIDWWELLRDERRLRPYDFEFQFSVAGQRDAYHAENLAKLRATGAPQIASLLGFSDLYVPVVIDRAFTLVFFCGQWAKEVPTREVITGVWRALSGHEPAIDDVHFRHWVRCCLQVPVLSAEVQDGLVALGAQLGRLFSSRAGAAQSAIHRIREQVFLPIAHDDSWVDSCLDATGLTRPPWGLDDFMDARIVEETGLRHRPSQLAVLVPKPGSRPGGDQLDLWIQQRHFQHHALLLARRIPDVVAAALGDHAVLMALAAAPNLRGRARQTHFEGQCRSLQQMLQERAGLTSVAGMGMEVAPGQGLGQCFRQAAAALERALRERKALVRATPASAGDENFRAADLEAVGKRLQRAFELGGLDQAALDVVNYTREVLAATGGRTAAMTVHFLLLLRQVLGSLESRGVLHPARARILSMQTLDNLSAIPEPQGLIAEFERILAELAALGAQRARADRGERLRLAVEWLRQNLRAEDPLDACARRAGLASSSFRRTFRKYQGVSFAAWLRQERLDASRRMLVLSALSVGDVARDSGFRDVHTFIRCFRVRFGRTPGAFRRESRLDGLD